MGSDFSDSSDISDKSDLLKSDYNSGSQQCIGTVSKSCDSNEKSNRSDNYESSESKIGTILAAERG